MKNKLYKEIQRLHSISVKKPKYTLDEIALMVFEKGLTKKVLTKGRISQVIKKGEYELELSNRTKTK
uniref:Uncharacterized protein n=1 Tax=viral metagenome TaxID=1070528 RepID=A0A6M3XZK5_9ZZZZ